MQNQFYETRARIRPTRAYNLKKISSSTNWQRASKLPGILIRTKVLALDSIMNPSTMQAKYSSRKPSKSNPPFIGIRSWIQVGVQSTATVLLKICPILEAKNVLPSVRFIGRIWAPVKKKDPPLSVNPVLISIHLMGVVFKVSRLTSCKN